MGIKWDLFWLGWSSFFAGVDVATGDLLLAGIMVILSIYWTLNVLEKRA